MVTLACAAATASTDDSELLELQEAGVMMLTQVVRIFAQVSTVASCDKTVPYVCSFGVVVTEDGVFTLVLLTVCMVVSLSSAVFLRRIIFFFP